MNPLSQEFVSSESLEPIAESLERLVSWFEEYLEQIGNSPELWRAGVWAKKVAAQYLGLAVRDMPVDYGDDVAALQRRVRNLERRIARAQ